MTWQSFAAVRKESPTVGAVHVGTPPGRARARPFKAALAEVRRLFPGAQEAGATKRETIHIHASDADSFRKMLLAHPEVLRSALKREHRALKPLDDTTAHTPFPHDANALANLRPDQVPRFFGALTDPARLEVKTVRLGTLNAMQNRVDPAKVAAFRTGDVAASKKPVVVRLNGRNYIADGHHRLAADHLDGKATSEVHFLDLEPVSNALKRGKTLAFDIGVSAGEATWSMPLTIAKTDPDQRLIFGWASVVEKDGQLVVDKQGDIILPEALEAAAYDFVLFSRQQGDLHLRKGVGRLVESIVFTKDKQSALGVDLRKVGWWVGFHVDDDALWEAHKRGERPEFSIGGAAVRENVD